MRGRDGAEAPGVRGGVGDGEGGWVGLGWGGGGGVGEVGAKVLCRMGGGECC